MSDWDNTLFTVMKGTDQNRQIGSACPDIWCATSGNDELIQLLQHIL